MGGTHKKHKREHSRDRYRDYKRKSRSRTKSPPSLEYRRRRSLSRTRRDERRHRTRSRSPRDRFKDHKKDARPSTSCTNVRVEDKNATDNLSKEEREMRRLMGFCNFDTTKGKKVQGNDVGEVHYIVKRKYRQYMNRKGGFNRPLDFVA